MARAKWTPQKVAKLRELCPNTPLKTIALQLNLTLPQIHYKIKKLGLRRDKENVEQEETVSTTTTLEQQTILIREMMEKWLNELREKRAIHYKLISEAKRAGMSDDRLAMLESVEGKKIDTLDDSILDIGEQLERLPKPKLITDDKPTTWVGLLEKLDSDEQFRNDMGYDAELHKLAAQSKAKKLAEYHEYEDGTVDQPLLDIEYLIQ